MRLGLTIFFVAVLCTAGLVAFSGPESHPTARIDNGLLHAELYLPNTDDGYYRGSRFDWSGVVARLEYKHHDYFGVWFPHYDPHLHDAITGPVEEFRSGPTTLGSALGYDQAAANGLFVKIGVGVLRKPDLSEYTFARPYPIVNNGVWTCRPSAAAVEFEQELHDDLGYSYIYSKTVRLLDRRPEMVLEHRLRNIGKKTIDTDVYDHDFYVLDGQPTGPAARIVFAFQPASADEDHWSNAKDLAGKAVIDKNEIHYLRELKEGESAASLLKGFSDSVADNDIRVENSKAGIGVREVGDHPLVRLNLWSIRTTICPEAFIHLHVEPGKEVRWTIRYAFYELNHR